MTNTTQPATSDDEPGGLIERRQFLELFALREDAVTALAENLDSTEIEIMRLALRYIALELIKVSSEHEIETGDALQATKYTSGVVAGLLGIQHGTDDHPYPESFAIGNRERARFVGDTIAAQDAQARIDQMMGISD